MSHALWGLWGGAVAEPISNQAATLVVGVVLGPVAAGAFFAANRLSQLLAIPLVGVTLVSGPMLARAWKTGATDQLRKVFWGTAAVATLGTVIGVVAMLVIGRHALAMFNPAYGSAFFALVVLSVAQLANAVAGSVKTLYNMTGHERRFLGIEVLWAAVGIGLVWWCGANHGLTGAALGFLLQRCGRNFHAVINVWAIIGLGSLRKSPVAT